MHDFPGDIPRFAQRADGAEHTFVNGQLAFADGRLDEVGTGMALEYDR